MPELDSVFEKTKLNNQDSMRHGGLCSYNAVRNLHTWPQLQSYVDFLKTHIDIYWKELNYDLNRQPQIFEMWANIYKHGSFIDIHNHSPIQLP